MHASTDHRFRCQTSQLDSIGKGVDQRVVAQRHQRRHVLSLTHRRVPSSAEATATLERRARLVALGRDAQESGKSLGVVKAGVLRSNLNFFQT